MKGKISVRQIVYLVLSVISLVLFALWATSFLYSLFLARVLARDLKSFLSYVINVGFLSDVLIGGTTLRILYLYFAIILATAARIVRVTSSNQLLQIVDGKGKKFAKPDTFKNIVTAIGCVAFAASFFDICVKYVKYYSFSEEWWTYALRSRFLITGGVLGVALLCAGVVVAIRALLNLRKWNKLEKQINDGSFNATVEAQSGKSAGRAGKVAVILMVVAAAFSVVMCVLFSIKYRGVSAGANRLKIKWIVLIAVLLFSAVAYVVCVKKFRQASSSAADSNKANHNEPFALSKLPNMPEQQQEVKLVYREANGGDLFELCKQRDALSVDDKLSAPPIAVHSSFDKDDSICVLYALQYGQTPEERTYAVWVFVDEQGEAGQQPFVGQIIRNADGATEILFVDNDDFAEVILTDMNRRMERDMAAKGIPNGGSGETLTRKQRFKLPNKAWFAQQGMPLKEIPIDKKHLKRGFDDDEKFILSVASFAQAKVKSLIMLGIVAVAAIVLGVFASTGNTINLIIGIVVVMLFGGALTYRTTRLLEGLSILGAASRIGIPIYWSLLFMVLSIIGNLLSFYMQFFFILLDMTRRNAMTSMPRVAMPQNCEFDEMISAYSAYEQSASISQAWDEHVAHLEKDNYDRKTRELNDLKSEVNNSDISSLDKSDLNSRIDSKQKQLDEDYEKHTKPRL